MKNYDVARFRDLLGPIGTRLRLQDPAAMGAVWRRWPDIVGDDIARNAEPTSLKEGVLRIRTASPTWATEMSYLAPDIADRVNRAVGKQLVTEVKVWTSPAPIRTRRGGPDHVTAPPSQVEKRAPAEDPLTAFQRAFRAWSERRSKGRS